MRRKLNKTFVVMMLLGVFAAACTEDTPSSSPNTLVVALGAAPKTLDPRFATDASGMRIAGLLFNSLVRIGPELEVVGDAARSWNYDDKVYTFELRKNLSFSNGRPLKKEDILFTFQEYKSDDSPFQSALKIIDDVQVHKKKGRFIVKIKLKKYSAKFLSSDLPTVKLLPKKEIKKAGKDFSEILIGTGSFTFKKQTTNKIVLKARAQHTVEAPKVEKLVFKIIRDDFTRFQKTLKGSVDIAQASLPPTKTSEFEKQPEKFDVYKYPGLSMSYILINLKDPILSRIKARQAIAYGINRKNIIEYKLDGLATRATSLLTPNNPFFHEDLPQYSFNKSKASNLVDELGDTEKKLVLKTSNNQTAVQNGRVLTQQLREIGLNVKLQSYEWGTFYGDIKKGNFQLATMRWVGAMDPDIYRIAFHSEETPPGRNRGYYTNAKLDHLLEKGLKIEKRQKRIQHYKKVQKIIHKDLPIVPLWYDHQVAVVHKRVQGYEPAKNGSFHPFVDVSKKSN